MHALHAHFSGLCAGGGFSEAAPFTAERGAGAFFWEEEVVLQEAAGASRLGTLASSSLLSAGKALAPRLPPDVFFRNDAAGDFSRLIRGARLTVLSHRTWQKRSRGYD